MAKSKEPGFIARQMKEQEQRRKCAAAIAEARRKDACKVAVAVEPGLWILVRPDEDRVAAVARFRKRLGMK